MHLFEDHHSPSPDTVASEHNIHAIQGGMATPSEPSGRLSNTTLYPNSSSEGPYAADNSSLASRFPYTVVIIICIWILFICAYALCRWAQKPKAVYIIPRVFVLCSPRTVQYHYELILRIGLQSHDFNPDKHDIDITILGANNNEVVPMTRLNTRTLQDEQLITSLSIIVYRLVEMPPLGGLILRHSGPYRAWVFAYDFTLIDLSTNKELYYTLNRYVGSINKLMPLREPNANTEVHYPIDDVPLPQWQLEDIFLFQYAITSCIMLLVTHLPINCQWQYDMFVVMIAAVGGVTIGFFLEWLFYFHIKWNQDRKEFFNDYTTSKLCLNETATRIAVATLASALLALTIYFALAIKDWRASIVWLLVVVNSCMVVIGVWAVSRQIELGENIVNFGLRLRGIDTQPIGLRYSELVSDVAQTKSASNSDDEGSVVSHPSRLASLTSHGSQGSRGNVSSMSLASRFGGRLGLGRSSVKSFGFNPTSKHSAYNLHPMSAQSHQSMPGPSPSQDAKKS